MKTYLIGDIAKKMNVTTDTLRYYDKEGLLPFAKRNERVGEFSRKMI